MEEVYKSNQNESLKVLRKLDLNIYEKCTIEKSA